MKEYQYQCGICGKKSPATCATEDIWNPSVIVVADDFDFNSKADSQADSGKWVDCIVCDTCDKAIRPHVFDVESVEHVSLENVLATCKVVPPAMK